MKVNGAAVTGSVGVPLMSPLDAFNVNPPGSVPAVSCQVKAPVPPVAARVCEYATPAWPFGREVVVMVSGAGAIVRLSVAVVL